MLAHRVRGWYGTQYSYVTEAFGYNVNGQLNSLNWTTKTYGVNYYDCGNYTFCDPQMAGLKSTTSNGGITYSYSPNQSNGQITQAVDTLSGETVAYQYDALKRLVSAASTPNSGSTPAAWTQNFQYDGFGNLTGKVLNGNTTTIAVNAATNRLANASYDLNGRMTSGAGATLYYDEANRLGWVYPTGGGEITYGYDPANKQIYRNVTTSQNTSTEAWTFYGAKGEKLGVYSLSAPVQQTSGCSSLCPWTYTFNPVYVDIWFGGKLIAETYGAGGAVYADRVGTNRAQGARFYPYGDEITSTGNDHEKFATYTRDSYTGLDYADQRYYASTYGRFNTADPYQASAGPADPGSWNRYSYVGGDPMNRYDPPGLDWWDASTNTLHGDGLSIGGGSGKGGPKLTPQQGQPVDPLPVLRTIKLTTSVNCHDLANNALKGNALQKLAGSISAMGGSLVSDFKNFTSFLSSTGTAASMTWEWATGTGSDSRTFDPSSLQSADMLSSVLVADAVKQYLSTGKFVGGESFGVYDVIAAGANPTQQFVGSFTYSIGLNNDGSLAVDIWNNTSFTSASYGQGPSWSRDQFGPGGNMAQDFLLNIPCN